MPPPPPRQRRDEPQPLPALTEWVGVQGEFRHVQEKTGARHAPGEVLATFLPGVSMATDDSSWMAITLGSCVFLILNQLQRLRRHVLTTLAGDLSYEPLRHHRVTGT